MKTWDKVRRDSEVSSEIKKKKVVVPVTKILFLCFSEFQKYHEIFVEKLKNTIKLNIKIKTTDNLTISENI